MTMAFSADMSPEEIAAKLTEMTGGRHVYDAAFVTKMELLTGKPFLELSPEDLEHAAELNRTLAESELCIQLEGADGARTIRTLLTKYHAENFDELIGRIGELSDEEQDELKSAVGSFVLATRFDE
jgi:hypothetical protein